MILQGLALLLADIATSLSPAPQPLEQIAVQAGTPVHFVTVSPLNSRTVKQGQRFELRVSEDVTVESKLVVPKGTPAVGEVEGVSGKGMVGKAGRLVLTPLFADVGGERIYLTGSTDHRGKDSTTGVAFGSLLLSGWGMFITGRSASIPAGSALHGRVRTSVKLPVLPKPDQDTTSSSTKLPPASSGR